MVVWNSLSRSIRPSTTGTPALMCDELPRLGIEVDEPRPDRQLPSGLIEHCRLFGDWYRPSIDVAENYHPVRNCLTCPRVATAPLIIWVCTFRIRNICSEPHHGPLGMHIRDDAVRLDHHTIVSQLVVNYMWLSPRLIVNECDQRVCSAVRLRLCLGQLQNSLDAR